MTDWKGNIIQDGDTVVLYSKQNRTHKGCELDIVEQDGEIYFVWMKVGEKEYIKELSIFVGDSILICIKGKSDNQEDYYKEYFKA